MGAANLCPRTLPRQLEISKNEKYRMKARRPEMVIIQLIPVIRRRVGDMLFSS